MAESQAKTNDSIRRWWPMFVVGLLGPFLGKYLQNWLAAHLAVALVFFLAWMVAGVFFLRFPPHPAWRFPRWMIGGALGAVVAGSLTFWFK